MSSVVQCVQSASVTSPDNLQYTSGNFASCPYPLFPLAYLAAPDIRLRQVIEHEALPAEPRDELGRGGQVSRVNQEVVGEAATLEQRDAATKSRPQHEAIVGLVLHDMADADELRMRGESRQLLCGVVRLQIDPANDSRDKGVRIRQLEQPLGFAECLAGLNGDAGVDRRAFHIAAELRRQEIAAQHAHRAVDPAVLRGGVAPEMLV